MTRVPTSRFEAFIKRGRIPVGDAVGALPPDVERARSHWTRQDRQCLELLQPLVRCTFVPHNLTSAIDELLMHDDEEIAASLVTIHEVDFTDRVLPVLTATASFELGLRTPMTQALLDAWQATHDYLDQGISFEWEIELPEELQGIPWDHEGLSMRLVEP